MHANCFIWCSTEGAIVCSKTRGKFCYIELTEKLYAGPKVAPL